MCSKLVLAAGAVAVAAAHSAFAIPVSQFNQLVVFGDSLSDSGNVSLATGGLIPGTNYWNGRFTDGPTTTPATSGPIGNWVDQFSTLSGISDPAPYLAGGTNYAVGGANTGSAALYDISNQIAAFSAGHLSGASASALYAIWGGANDLFTGSTNPATAADRLYANILTLSGQGAKYFLWFDLPDLGATPYGRNNSSASLTAATTAFNAEWSLDLQKLGSAGVNVISVDVNSLFAQIKANPGAYGFTDIVDPAQGLTGVNPNNYLFWDDKHPTTAGAALVANLAYTDLVNAPEPLNTALVLVGLLGLTGVRKFRRAR